MSLIKRKRFGKRNVSQCQVIFAFTGLSLSDLNHIKLYSCIFNATSGL